jgi:hypothetical protein
MATKNYYLQQKVVEVFPSEASLANLARAPLDLGYLYDNIGLADPYARRVLDHFKEIWKLECKSSRSSANLFQKAYAMSDPLFPWKFTTAALIAKKGPQGAA